MIVLPQLPKYLELGICTSRPAFNLSSVISRLSEAAQALEGLGSLLHCVRGGVWCPLVLSALGKQRHEDKVFRTSLGCVSLKQILSFLSPSQK